MEDKTLNDIMEFDHVIEVHQDGSVTHRADIYAPELVDDTVSDGWELLNGYSGQYLYSGPVMHSSEFIGGRMADDILSTPGIYVAVVATTTDKEFAEDNIYGWAVARKIS